MVRKLFSEFFQVLSEGGGFSKKIPIFFGVFKFQPISVSSVLSNYYILYRVLRGAQKFNFDDFKKNCSGG